MVFLYDNQSDLALLSKKIVDFTDTGSSVIALKKLPEKLKYKKLLKIQGKEVTLLENNA